ncbi:hypothetical protein ACJEKK_25575, partial [Escherichia coli]
ILVYVIMPDHYHLVIEFHEPADLHGWLHDFQMHTANQIAKWLRETGTAEDLSVFSRHANGKAKLAVWKEQARALGIVREETLRTK